MSDNDRQMIKNVAYTLNTISVCGSDNLDKLLGCIQVLNTLVTESANEDPPSETKSLQGGEI